MTLPPDLDLGPTEPVEYRSSSITLEGEHVPPPSAEPPSAEPRSVATADTAWSARACVARVFAECEEAGPVPVAPGDVSEWGPTLPVTGVMGTYWLASGSRVEIAFDSSAGAAVDDDD